MEQLSKINLPQQIQTEKELELQSKLKELCPVCGEHIYKAYNIFGKDRILPVSCKCKRQQNAEKEKIETAKEKQIRLGNLIKNSLMDKKFANSTFENWDFKKGSKQMYELGNRYVNNFLKCKDEGLGLLVYGEPGNGKTYLVSAIANALLNKYVTVICVSTNGLLSRIQETYNRWGSEAEADIIRGLSNADLLIIDDLGTEKGTDWSKSMIYNIIDSRYRSNLPLIITSNLSIDPQVKDGMLAKLYNRRTEDRILEMCTPVLNTAQGIRIDEAKKKTKMLKDFLY